MFAMPCFRQAIWTVSWSMKTTVKCTTVRTEYRASHSHPAVVFHLWNKTPTGYATCIVLCSQTPSCLHFCIAQVAGRGLEISQVLMFNFSNTLGKFWSRTAVFDRPRFSSITQEHADTSTCGCKSCSLAPRYEHGQNKYCIGKLQEPSSLTNDVTKKKWRRGIGRYYIWLIWKCLKGTQRKERNWIPTGWP